jgi:cytochrome P450
LRREPALVPLAVEEMLRYEGPIQLNNRRLTAPLALAGKTLPAGAFITLGIGAANRDPRQFPHAERFDVARKPNRHVAFGHGDHACAGMNVARMEARIAFSRLLALFPKLELSAAPERDRRIRFRGFRKLPVRTAV